MADIPEVLERIEADDRPALAKNLQEMTQRIDRVVYFAKMAATMEKSTKLMAKVEEGLVPLKLGLHTPDCPSFQSK